MRILLVALLLLGCSGKVASELPAGCDYTSDKVRGQICGGYKSAITCSNVEQTNPMPGECVGVGERQVIGNGWCCEPLEGCSHEWSLCAARSDSQVTLWSNGATVTASCTFESSGVGSTYACSWPESR